MLTPGKSRSQVSPISDASKSVPDWQSNLRASSDCLSCQSSVDTPRSEKHQMKRVLEKATDGHGNVKDMGKMIGAIAIPLVALAVMSALSVAATGSQLQASYTTLAAISSGERITAVVLALQVERGLTATFVSGNRSLVGLSEMLRRKRSVTDRAIDRVEVCPALNFSGEICTTTSCLLRALDTYRSLVDMKGSELPITDPITFYTAAIHQLLLKSRKQSIKLKDGTLWPHLVCKDSLLHVSDFYGIQRAIGSSFFAGCHISPVNLEWFRNLYSSAESQIETLFSYSARAAIKYQKLLRSKASVKDSLSTMRDEIFRGGNPCVHHGEEKAARLSTYWFGNMTIFIEILAEVISAEADYIASKVDEIITDAVHGVAVNVTLLVLTVIVSLSLGIIQLLQAKQLLRKIGHYARNLCQRTKELAAEKCTTERLLYQMMPRSVAEQLKQRKALIAEEFENVTIYFSDIVEFTSLAKRSTPMQVVELLNDLYSTFDSYVDMYNVYKVETIGDAYMVAAGLPEPTDLHAFEIACMALDLLREAKLFRIPHLPRGKLSLRVGIHSGSCVAGVAGIKMPRYCLFGDTVNTAARMESTGKAQKIQISEATRRELVRYASKTNREFVIVTRGSTVVKGKGNMQTYWLSEKHQADEQGYTQLNVLPSLNDKPQHFKTCLNIKEENP